MPYDMFVLNDAVSWSHRPPNVSYFVLYHHAEKKSKLGLNLSNFLPFVVEPCGYLHFFSMATSDAQLHSPLQQSQVFLGTFSCWSWNQHVIVVVVLAFPFYTPSFHSINYFLLKSPKNLTKPVCNVPELFSGKCRSDTSLLFALPFPKIFHLPIRDRLKDWSLKHALPWQYAINSDVLDAFWTPKCFDPNTTKLRLGWFSGGGTTALKFPRLPSSRLLNVGSYVFGWLPQLILHL